MKPSKISTLLVTMVLPFFASCATWHEASIANGLDRGGLTYSAALEAMNNGADVKGNFAGKCFLEQAAKLNRQDLIELFVKKGGVSCFEADAGYKNKPFSLFMHAYKNRNEDLMLFCLKHPDKSKEVMRSQLLEVANQMFDLFVGNHRKSTWASMRILSAICETGVLDFNEQIRFSLASINAVKAKKFLARCASGNIRYDGRFHYSGNNFITKEEANAEDENGNSALILFLKNCDRLRVEDLDVFISGGSNVNAKDSDGHSVLFLCFTHENRDRECLEILQNADARFTAEEATAFLSKIVKEKEDSIAGLTWNGLILQGADVNTKIDGHSLLYIAKSNGSEFCSILENAGAKLLPEESEQLQNELNKNLISAVKSGDVELVERCIKNGADVNVNTTAKDGTIHSLLMVPELLAIPNEAMYAVAQRQEEPGWFLALSGYSSAPKKIATILKNAGAKMSKEDEELVKTVRLQAHIAGGNWDMIAAGMKTGIVDLNSKFSNGENCFHALANCHLEIDESFVSALKNSGCDINKKSESGYSPLAKAIEKTSATAVKVLLKHGANPNDSIPIKGAFGNAGTKKLMALSIDVYNKCVDEHRNTNYSNSDAVEEARGKTRRAKEIVSLMSQATGTSVTEL